MNVYGETTPGLELSATVSSNQSVTLSWIDNSNAVPAESFDVYRGTSPDSLVLLKCGVTDTTFKDDGTFTPQPLMKPPFEYYTLGTTSTGMLPTSRRIACSLPKMSVPTVSTTASPTPTKAVSRVTWTSLLETSIP